MPRYRIRYEEPSSSGTLTNLVLGALAGFAVGVLVAQKSGGIAGIAAGVKRRLSELATDEGAAEPDALTPHDVGFEDDLDEDELDAVAVEEDVYEGDEPPASDDAEADEDDEAIAAADDADEAAMRLEEDVLDAFRADRTLRDRAIDISAVGAGVIELSGWVDSDAESQQAAAVARRIPGVESVVNRLAVGNADGGVEDDAAEHDGESERRSRRGDPDRGAGSEPGEARRPR